MLEKLYCCASAAFGLESLVASELRELNMENVKAENGLVRFCASPEELFICNLKLRFCERVFIIAAEKSCTTFEDLFQLVSGVSWQDYADGTESFLISAKCARSRLMSPRDCQSITKKAIIEKLRKVRHLSVFPENGPPFPVSVSIHSDLARILINTSGDALSRRGYRTWNGEAPLRETLAAALVRLSPWRSSLPLCDPCCGTGTGGGRPGFPIPAGRHLYGGAQPYSAGPVGRKTGRPKPLRQRGGRSGRAGRQMAAADGNGMPQRG